MKIKSVSVYTCDEPLKVPFQTASSGHMTKLEGVFVKLTAENEVFGFGEVRGNCSYFTGDTTGAVVATISSVIAPKLIGLDINSINTVHDIIQNSIVGNMAAKNACECAAFDLLGKTKNVPVYQLLGGKRKSTLASEENIPFMSSEEAAERTKGILDAGCRCIKVRVGADDFNYDLERVKTIWSVITAKGLQSEVVFSMDANQAWDTFQAIRNIKILSEYGITIVEQPVRDNSPLKLRQLKDNCPIKLFADEKVGTVDDLVRYIEMGVIDGVHIKLIKCGGIVNAIKMMQVAEAHQVDYMIGGMDEGMLAVAAAVHCAAVATTDLFEVHGHVRIGDDPSQGLEVQGSNVIVPDSPGFGIDVNESKLSQVCIVK